MRLSDIVPLHLATVVFPDFHPLAGQEGVVRGFVIRHESGPILLDTGVGLGNGDIDRWYQPKSVRIENALAEAGLDVTDLLAVVNSHLHFEHSGQNQAAGSCPVYVQLAELAAADAPNFTIREWVRFPGANYVELDGDYDLVPGVRLLSTPGHTPGHQSVVVETDEGLIVIAGQAIYSAREFLHLKSTRSLLEGDPPPDPSAYVESALRIIDLQPAAVFFSHDETTVRAIDSRPMADS
ncbi:MAG: N-acyl homoserine lactonase family protein [Dehalococcoidia bacterium]